MKSRECDLCDKTIEGNTGVSFGCHDLCNKCIKIVRCAVCKQCHGEGIVSAVDYEATHAQATCGENRTQYKTIACKHCK